MNNNIYIGDNLKVLNHALLSPYINKVKVIYIDPPYNTLTQKSYADNVLDEVWLNDFSDRLKACYKYLKDDGIIFISIDDNEYAYAKIACDKIFGRNNFIGTFITMQAQRSNSKLINTVHEYVICFAKNKLAVKPFCIKRIDIPEQNEMITSLQNKIKAEFNANGKESAEKLLSSCIKEICKQYHITWIKNYNCVDDRGLIYFATDLSTPGKPRTVDIAQINLSLSALPTRGWSSDAKFIELYKNNRLVFRNGRPYAKKYLTESTDNIQSILNFFSRQGTNNLNNLGLRDLFDTPKPVELLKTLFRISINDKDDLIMDFYAGSGSTAQAVYEINKEDNLNLSYILIQRNESVSIKSKSYSACQKFEIEPSIPEILKFRINTFLKKYNIKDPELKFIKI